MMSDKYYDKLWEMWCECEEPNRKAAYMWELIEADELNLKEGNPKSYDECVEWCRKKLQEKDEDDRRDAEEFLKCAYIRANTAIDSIVTLRVTGADIQNSEMEAMISHLLMAMKDIEKARYEL